KATRAQASPGFVGQELTEALQVGGELALLVDDAQWADRASMAALQYAAHRLRDDPVLLILAYRRHGDDSLPEYMTVSPGLSKAWRQIFDGEQGLHLALDGLTPEDLLRLAAAYGHPRRPPKARPPARKHRREPWPRARTARTAAHALDRDRQRATPGATRPRPYDHRAARVVFPADQGTGRRRGGARAAVQRRLAAGGHRAGDHRRAHRGGDRRGPAGRGAGHRRAGTGLRPGPHPGGHLPGPWPGRPRPAASALRPARRSLGPAAPDRRRRRSRRTARRRPAARRAGADGGAGHPARGRL